MSVSRIVLTTSLLLVVALSGCGSGTDESKAADESKDATQTALVKADAADGSEDQVVSKCITCALHMDGSPDHKVTAHGYDFHLCSANCAKKFEGNPDMAIGLIGKK